MSPFLNYTFQSSQDGKLEQFGSPAKELHFKWQEFVQRHPISIDDDGMKYLKRTFEARNANNLFSAGTPKQ